jgi:tRNA threonylcarbamoyladenosine biosynthesis protein TsaE
MPTSTERAGSGSAASPGIARPEAIDDHRRIQTETAAPDETEAVAARLAQRLRPGDIVLVSGDLGAGKTTFVRGACRALGVTAAVTSPSFTIARRYEATVPISHLDLYRLGDLDAEDPALLADELAGDRIAFVEWPEVGTPVGLDAERIAARVRLEHRGGDRRLVVVDP